MKTFTLLTLLVGICSQLVAQRDSSLLMIEDAIRSRKGVDKIVYLDSSMKIYFPFSELIKKGKVKGWKDEVQTYMRFTKKEIEAIKAQAAATSVIAWPDSLFSNSVRIHADTLKLLFRDAKSYAYFKQHYVQKYFAFSQPVFVKDGGLVLFIMTEVYESCGHIYLFIYERNPGLWKQRMLVRVGSW